MTIYLSFPSEQVANQLAKEAGYVVEVPVLDENHTQVATQETLQAFTHDRSIDVLGVIYKPTGVMLKSEDGFEYPETKAVDGWHWNVQCEELPAEFKQYEVFPSTPVREFA